MMRKYNKPEIVTLALEMVDVIETSAQDLGAAALAGEGIEMDNITKLEQQVTKMNDNWTW